MTDGQYVVLDTNALLLPFSDGTDIELELSEIFGHIRMVVPSSVKQELLSLAGGKGAVAANSSAAIKFLGRCRLEPTGLPGDDGVLEVARRLQAAVLSNDRNVRTEAKKSGLPVARSKANGKLTLD